MSKSYNPGKANKVICNYLQLPIQETLNYDILFLAINKIQSTPHPKWSDYNFHLTIDNHHVFINIGANTNGLDGCFNELFPMVEYRLDAMKRCIWNWITWYNNINP